MGKYPKKFDNSTLTDLDRQLLSQFTKRRHWIEAHLKLKKITDRFACPSCGFPTLGKRNCCGICYICNWEDDGQDDSNADEVCGGPNYNLSLTESRLIIAREIHNLVLQSKQNIIQSSDKLLDVVISGGTEHAEKLQNVLGDDMSAETDWQKVESVMSRFHNKILLKLFE